MGMCVHARRRSQTFEPADTGQGQVEMIHVRPAARHHVERLFAVVCKHHLIAANCSVTYRALFESRARRRHQDRLTLT